MTFYNKIKWVLGILIVFALIITTNLIDKNNYSKVGNSIVTIYEDRLIAKDLIFKISNAIHQKEIAAISANTTFFETTNNLTNKNIQTYIDKYESTKLTKEESSVFDDLKTNFNNLEKFEKTFKENDNKLYKNLIDKINTLKVNLNQLSKIQINEANKQMSISKRAIDTIDLFTKIEIYILIFLAITIQIIIIYKPKNK